MLIGVNGQELKKKELSPQLRAFHEILKTLWENGQECRPRGLLIKELCAFTYTLPPRWRFMCLDARKLKLDYLKQEFLWYLRGDPKDLSILNIASMWRDLVNEDGTINSNYGVYMFNDIASPGHESNFERVARTLEDDPDSRRAVMMILSNEHLCSTTKDYPCTAYLNFQIRNNHLNLYVRMRSQDAIWGMGNDVACFSFTHELMYARLCRKFPDLQMGHYSHMADSFHIYERHFKMVESIANNPTAELDHHMACPPMAINGSVDQVDELFHVARNIAPYKTGEKSPRNLLPFTRWLITRDDPSTLL